MKSNSIRPLSIKCDLCGNRLYIDYHWHPGIGLDSNLRQYRHFNDSRKLCSNVIYKMVSPDTSQAETIPHLVS